LNGALGATSIVVTHDVEEALKIVDYVYYLSQGRIVAQGTPHEMRANPDPLVRQFVYGEAEGPVKYQYPSRPIAEEFSV
jgi:phospholipid/cholesterol/gamma-HCH transport system ATP-binding protein